MIVPAGRHPAAFGAASSGTIRETTTITRAGVRLSPPAPEGAPHDLHR
jgi:hypothetical protein